MTSGAAQALREPFRPEQIGKLPRAGIQLDYVGHAAVTDRLLSVDPLWSWEPVAFDVDGSPLIRRDGKDARLWIRLTICGVTRYGVGIVAGNAFELEKQLISDAIRNAAMRFGVALDLWTKQDLHDMASLPEPGTGRNLGPVDELSPRELNAALADRGLALGGTLEQMRDRLAAAMEDAPLPEPHIVDVPLPLPDGEGNGYDRWSKGELQAECADRQIDIPVSYNKAKLVAALRAWDRTYQPDHTETESRP